MIQSQQSSTKKLLKMKAQNCHAMAELGQTYYYFSDIITQSYMKQQQQHPIFCSGQIKILNQWMQSKAQSNSQMPFLIFADTYAGKKTLLSSFAEQLNKNKNTIVISEFGSVTPLYSDILNAIMTKLRHKLNISQKVELNEEKLRRYFPYWLDIASRALQKESIGYRQNQRKKIVIMIQGMDKIVDSKNNSVSPGFWLPATIPKNISLILTITNNTPIHQFYQNKIRSGVQIPLLKYVLTKEKKNSILNSLTMGKEILNQIMESVPQILIWELKIIDSFIKKSAGKFKPNLEKFNNNNHKYQRKRSNSLNHSSSFHNSEKQIHIVQILSQYINFIGNQLLCKANQEAIKDVLKFLLYSKKGLNIQQLKKLTGLSKKVIKAICFNFSPIILQFGEVKLIPDYKVKNIIASYLNINFQQPDKFQNKSYHQVIAKMLKREPQTARKLQQHIYHLLKCENFAELKQNISRIQNFLVLFTPYTKNLLCSCWVKLQIQLQYDPVVQYNKAVQRFLNHYYPKQEDIFKIIFQVSLFFKEFSDFQSSKTPQFRHPIIKGEKDQLNQMCIYQEFEAMKMIRRNKQFKKKGIQQIINDSNIKNVQVSKNQQETEETAENLNFKQQHNQCLMNEKPQRKQIEHLNIAIPSNRKKFSQFYLSIMQDYLQKYYQGSKKNTQSQSDEKGLFSIEDPDSDQQLDLDICVDKKIQIQDIQTIKNSLIFKSYDEYREQDYHRNGEQKAFYYYKRWLWLQFPWISQSLQKDFSQLIKTCMESSTQFMSIKQQKQLIQDVLKIAKVAKQSKAQIFQKSNIENVKGILNGKSKNINMLKQISSDQQEENEVLRQTKTKKIVINDKLSETTLKKSKATIIKQLGKMNLNDVSMSKEFDSNKGNQNKWKLNVNFLEQQLKQAFSKRQEISNKLRKKKQQSSKVFITNQNNISNNNVFITEQHSQKYSLPKLSLQNIEKISRTTELRKNQNQSVERYFKNSSVKVPQRLEQRDTNQCIRKFNELKHENEILIERIQDMKNSIIMNENGINKLQDKKIENNINALNEKKLALMKTYKTQQALKCKLETIKKICEINKTHGSQSQDLSVFLSSLKSMTQQQEKKAQAIRSDIIKKMEQHRIQIKNLKQNKKELQKKLGNRKKSKNKSTKKLNEDENENLNKPKNNANPKKQSIIKQTRQRNSQSRNSSYSQQKHRYRKSPTKSNFNKSSDLNRQSLQRQHILDLLHQMNLTQEDLDENKLAISEFKAKLQKKYELEQASQQLLSRIQKNQNQLNEINQKSKLKVDKNYQNHISKLQQTKQIQQLQTRIKILSQCLGQIRQLNQKGQENDKNEIE